MFCWDILFVESHRYLLCAIVGHSLALSLFVPKTDGRRREKEK